MKEQPRTGSTRRPIEQILIILIFTILAGTRSSQASPMFPCVSAAGSDKGNMLVVSDTQFESPESEEVRRFAALQKGKPQDFLLIRQVSFQVYSRESFINAKDHMTSSFAFWGGWNRWKVTLDAHNESDRQFTGFCALPLISDNGIFLVLLNTGPTLARTSALRIYRKAPIPESALLSGVLVRDISLSEIWPKDQPVDEFWHDGTPTWFAGGTFDFSVDSAQLVHKTRWGNTVRIDLATGNVLRDAGVEELTRPEMIIRK